LAVVVLVELTHRVISIPVTGLHHQSWVALSTLVRPVVEMENTTTTAQLMAMADQVVAQSMQLAEELRETVYLEKAITAVKVLLIFPHGQQVAAVVVLMLWAEQVILPMVVMVEQEKHHQLPAHQLHAAAAVVVRAIQADQQEPAAQVVVVMVELQQSDRLDLQTPAAVVAAAVELTAEMVVPA
jgi:hypothetical protein